MFNSFSVWQFCTMLNGIDSFFGGVWGVGGKGEGTCASKLENYEAGYLLDE